MQTTDTQTPKKKEPPIDEQIEAAQAELARLRAILADDEVEEKRWSIAFEKDPTAETHSQREIYKQRVVNARAEADRHEVEVVHALQSLKRSIERQAIEADILAREREAEAEFGRAFDLVSAAIEAFESGVRKFHDLDHPRRKALSQGVGLGVWSLERVFASLQSKLKYPTYDPYWLRFASVVLAHIGQNDEHVQVKFALPTGRGK